MTDDQKDLFDALELFIKRFRIFIVAKIQGLHPGNPWEDSFRNIYLKNIGTSTANSPSQMSWDNSISNKGHKQSIDCIDYQFLKTVGFTMKQVLTPEFGNKCGSLATWFGEIVEVRNNIAHFTAEYLSDNDIKKVWIHFEEIAKCIKDQDLMNGINEIKARETRRKVNSVLEEKFIKEMDELKEENLRLKEDILRLQLKPKYKPSVRRQSISSIVPKTVRDKKWVEQTLGHYKEIIDRAPDAGSHNNYGFLLYSLAILKGIDYKLLDDAAKNFKAALNLDPKLYEAHNNLGNILKKQAEKDGGNDLLLQEAITHYKKAIELNNEYYDALNNCGHSYHLLGNGKESDERDDLLKYALEYYLKAKSLSQDNYQAYNIACIYAQFNENKNALDYLKLALKNKRYDNQKLLSDNDLQNLMDDQEFIEILALNSSSKVNSH